MGFRLQKKGRDGDVALAAEDTGPETKMQEEPGRECGGDTVRLSFRLPKKLHTRLRLEAVRQGETIVGIVSRWVEDRTAAV